MAIDGIDFEKAVDDPKVRNVIMDLTGTDYFGSSALNLFLRIDKKAHQKNGRLILIGLSPHEVEVLHVSRLDERLTVGKSLDEALAALGHST
jgi:anti-anti-sigma factor